MSRILEIDENLTYGEQPKKAMELFTDREKPRKAALNEYEKLEKEISDGILNTHVIYYYGECGIGKTTLVEKLEMELDEKEAEKPGSGRHVKVDFMGFSGGKLNVIEDLACRLAEKYHFHFPRTTLALKRLYEPNLKETRLSGNPLVKSKKMEFLLSWFKIVPNINNYVELIAGIIDFLLPKLEFVTQRRNLRREMESIAAIDIKDVETHLPIYFSHDLNMNTAKAKHPLTIFLDTYEQYINQFESDFEGAQAKDEWLRDSCNGVIPYSKRILWIITGRNKLIPIKGGDVAKSWGDLDVSEHLLDYLSKSDTQCYLDYCGIKSPALREHLTRITHGSPMLLDFCYQIHCKLRNDPSKQSNPAEYGIGREELIQRYLQQYDVDMRQMILGLAALEDGWNDEILEFVKQSIPGFNEVKYKQLLNESFIHRNKDGSWSMSNAIRSVLENRLDPSGKQKIGAAYKQYLAKRLKEGKDPEANALRMLKRILESGTDVVDKFLSEIIPIFNSLLCKYRFEIPEEIVSRLEEHASKHSSDRELAALVCVEHTFLLSQKGDPQKAYAKLSEFVTDKKSVYDITSNEDLLMECFNKGGRVSNSAGYHAKAFELDKECLKLSNEVLGERHPNTLTSMNNLANDYRQLGMHDKAVEMDSEVLRLRKEILGEKHPDTLTSMSNLGADYRNLGIYDKALELDSEALRLWKEILGEKHPDTLISMNNLAVDYSNRGMYDKALALHSEVLKLNKEILGERHPDTLLSMSNLALDYSNLGMHGKALEMDSEVLRLRKEILGERHPNTLTSMSNLGADYRNLKKHDKALEMDSETLRLSKEILGERHPLTLTSMNNLGADYRNLGMHDKALEMDSETLRLRKEILGERHPDTLLSMGNIALDYSNLGMNGKALELDSEVLRLRKEILGERHQDTLTSMNNLANDYSNLGMNGKALEMDSEVLRLRKEILGEKHPDTLLSMGNLAFDYRNLGMNGKALELDSEVLRLRKEILGEKHPDTLLSMGNLAFDYRNLGMHDKALEMDSETLRLRKEILGEKHPDTLLSMGYLVADYLNLGLNDKAKQNLNELVPLFIEVLGEDHPNTISCKKWLNYLEQNC